MMKTKTARGFTLIELLVVIGIMLIIMSIALPGVSQFMASRIYNQSAQIVQTAFMRARSRAITQRTLHYVLVFTNASPKITLPKPSGGTKDFTAEAGTLLVVDSREKDDVVARHLQIVGQDPLTLPEQTRFHAGFPNFHVVFYYDGSCAIQGKVDAPSSNLFVTDIPASVSGFTTAFDMVITGPEEDFPITETAPHRRVYFDIIQGTGALKFRVYPK